MDPSYYFSYQPINIAPEACAAVFLLISIFLTIQTVRSASPSWLLILPMTAFCECVGYIFRTLCIYWTTLGTFTAMSLFLLLPPNALALTNYKTLGETLKLARNQKPRGGKPPFLLRPRFVTWFFFTSDVFSFLLQAGGVSVSTRDGMREVAKKMVLAGLAVQLFFFAAFLFLAIYVAMSKRYTARRGPRDKDGKMAKRRLFTTIIATTVLLYIRSVYRVVEFADGYGGRIYGTEWLFYVFDTALVLVSFLIYMVSFIGHHFSRRPYSRDEGDEGIFIEDIRCDRTRLIRRTAM
ncbi:RTA1 like protein [Martensiomyces pterosporus]|nr:RTA1 like protein [Martensiomyces pterosporus]